MQEMIDRIAADTGVDPALAHKATAMIVNFIVGHAPAEYVDTIRRHVPDLDQTAAIGAAHAEAAPASGGGLMGALGGLMGGGGLSGALGGLLGGSDQGGLGAAMAMLGRLQNDGLDLGQVQSIAGGLVDQLRRVAGDEVVDKMVADLPGVGRFLA